VHRVRQSRAARARMQFTVSVSQLNERESFKLTHFSYFS